MKYTTCKSCCQERLSASLCGICWQCLCILMSDPARFARHFVIGPMAYLPVASSLTVYAVAGDPLAAFITYAIGETLRKVVLHE